MGLLGRLPCQTKPFAAILADRSVVTWGHPGYGGDSSLVQDRLKDVWRIQASRRAFGSHPC